MKLSPAASTYLDLLRGTAAIAVFAGHLRSLCFVDFQDVTHRSPAVSALYFATGFGHQAVVAFFVLSGYFVGGSVLRARRQGTFSWSTFVSARMSRLLIVLWPALALGAACDLIGMRLQPEHALYLADSAFGNVVAVPVAKQLTANVAIGNALFLQTILTSNLGSNGALWSLANEFWYYLAFPLALDALLPGRPLLSRVLAGTAVVAIGLLVGREIVLYFPMWISGALLAVLPEWRFGRIPTRVGLLAAGAALFGTLALIRVGRLPYAPDYVLALCVLLMLGLIVHGTLDATAPRVLAWVGPFVAKSSYSLYVVHLPVVVLLVAVTHSANRWQPSLPTILAAAGIGATAYAVSLAMYWLFERQTPALRQHVDRWLGAGAAIKPGVES